MASGQDVTVVVSGNVMKISVKRSAPPASKSTADEVDTAERIISACRFPSFEPSPDSVTAFGAVTPWVSQQMGAMAERIGESGDSQWAIRTASASVYAAFLVRADEVLYENLLTLGNLNTESHHEEAAKLVYETLLSLPLPGGTVERPCAHFGLANQLRDRSNNRLAIYHYEMALSYFRELLPTDALIRLNKMLCFLYKETTDLAGVIHCAAQFKLANPEQLAAAQGGPEVSIDRILSLNTRLHFLGEHGLADLLRGTALTQKHSSTGESSHDTK